MLICSNTLDVLNIELVSLLEDIDDDTDDVYADVVNLFCADVIDVDEVIVLFVDEVLVGDVFVIFVDEVLFVVSIDDVCIVFVDDDSLIGVFDESSCDILIDGSCINVLLDDNVRLESLFVECVAVDDASDIFVDDGEVVFVDGVFRVDVDVDVESLGDVSADVDVDVIVDEELLVNGVDVFVDDSSGIITFSSISWISRSSKQTSRSIFLLKSSLSLHVSSSLIQRRASWLLVTSFILCWYPHPSPSFCSLSSFAYT